MASLKDMLPAPTDGLKVEEAAQTASTAEKAVAVIPATAPREAGVSKVVQIKQDATGELDYSAIVRQGENATRVVHTSRDAMVEKTRHEALRPLPTQQEADETTDRTRAALEKVISGKISAAKAKTSKSAAPAKPSFIRYTPANTNNEHNSGSRQRIIKMVEAPVDPMEPPRFAHRKAPVNPPSPPVPVMHSPDRKLSKKEAANWNIPPVVSNWKNNRGYTISLDKRLAADGRGLQDHSINDRFGALAEALYQAERTARENVEKSAQIHRQVSRKMKEAKEKQLRDLAARARQERKGYMDPSEYTDAASSRGPADDESSRTIRERTSPPQSDVPYIQRVEDTAPPSVSNDGDFAVPAARVRRNRFRPRASDATESAASEQVDEDVRRRDEIRRERREERERELRRRENQGIEEGGAMLKRSKLTRDQDRDISERVALGQSVNGGGGNGEVMYDQRLFNYEGGEGGGRSISLAGGYGAEDSYNLYEKPLFGGGNSATKFQYGRPQAAAKGDAADSSRFRPDKGFGGNDGQGGTGASRSGGVRDRPVEFERDSDLKSSANEDMFGLDKFLEDAKRGGK